MIESRIEHLQVCIRCGRLEFSGNRKDGGLWAQQGTEYADANFSVRKIIEMTRREFNLPDGGLTSISISWAGI